MIVYFRFWFVFEHLSLWHKDCWKKTELNFRVNGVRLKKYIITGNKVSKTQQVHLWFVVAIQDAKIYSCFFIHSVNNNNDEDNDKNVMYLRYDVMLEIYKVFDISWYAMVSSHYTKLKGIRSFKDYYNCWKWPSSAPSSH